jgi:hypothetical protein
MSCRVGVTRPDSSCSSSIIWMRVGTISAWVTPTDVTSSKIVLPPPANTMVAPASRLCDAHTAPATWKTGGMISSTARGSKPGNMVLFSAQFTRAYECRTAFGVPVAPEVK